MVGAGATIATRSGTGALFISCAAGGVDAGAAVVILQQHCARIAALGDTSCFFAFAGQQHDARTWPSMLHRYDVRANADDGNKTARVSRARTTRRTSPQP
jgi:hypothetical protein